jgi:phage tail-like protein
MALTKDEIKARYPLPAYNYRVSIEDQLVAFSQVSGLSMAYETTTHKESPVDGSAAGPVEMRMPAQHSDVTITLQKGVVVGKSVSALYNWISGIQTNLVEKKNILIDLCNEEGAPVVRWKVINAFPTSLEAPTFDATTNDVAIESLQLMADRLEMEEVG